MTNLNLKNTTKVRSFRTRMVFLIILCAVIPLLLIQGTNYRLTSKLIRQKDNNILNDNLLLCKNNASSILDSYHDLLYRITSSDTYSDSFAELNRSAPGTNSFHQAEELLLNTIRTNILDARDVLGVGVISKKGYVRTYVQKPKSAESIVNYFYDHIDEFRKEGSHKQPPALGTIHTDAVEKKGIYTSCMYLTCSTYNHDTLAFLGTLYIFVNPDTLNSSINNSDSQMYNISNKLILTADNTIVCSREGTTGMNINQLAEYSYLDFETLKDCENILIGNHLINITNLEHYQLKILDIIDYNLFTQELTTLWDTASILVAAILLLIILVAFITLRTEVSAIEKIASAMSNLREDNLSDIFVQIESKTEFQIIETSFNNMVTRIQQLLQENKQQYERLIDSNNQMHLAQLQSLELQINPHFLFNTLDSINWLAIQEGALSVSTPLNRLAQILRYTVYDVNGLVSLSSEKDWLIQYIELQKIRHQKRYTYDIFLSDSAKNYKIHKLLLQPFVENALIHGFENLNYPGHISVSCKILRNTYLSIFISNNGEKMDIQQIASINHLFTNVHSEIHTFSGIGLSNVAYRLKGYYPHSYTFSGTSGDITFFKIFIPLSEMEV